MKSISATEPTRKRADACAERLAESQNKTYLVFELVSAFGRKPPPKIPVQSLEVVEILDADTDAAEAEEEYDEEDEK